MLRRRGCILTTSILIVILIAAGWLIIRQQSRALSARNTYYNAILAQAPCIENVCPGFGEGQEQALEKIANGDFVQGNLQANGDLGLNFTHGEEIVGSGVIGFSTISQDDSAEYPITVHNVSVQLWDLNLKSVLDALGQPDEFLFISGCGMGSRVHAELYYLEQGVKAVVDYTSRNPGSEILSEDSPIQYVAYLQPSDDFALNSIRNFMDPYNITYEFHPSITANDVLLEVQAWPGIAASPAPSADFCTR